jgi:hypothetical protein
MTRKGKIARLPHPVREQVNRRLQNGEKGRQIVQWLNALPEVAAVMAAEFEGEPVSEMNLSRWKKGGYRDWEAEQPAVEAIQSLIQRSDAHQDAISDGLTDRMALFLMARMAAQLIHLDAAGNTAGQSDALGEWLIRLARMRRGEFHAQRLAIERERLELLRKKTRQEFEAECWKWATQEEVREQICQGFCYTEEEKRRRVRHILGFLPLDEQSGAAREPEACKNSESAQNHPKISL